MATPPDFTAGQILTAAQMNKIGLWTVKNKTTVTAASSVTADNVFSSDFANYRIVIRYITSGASGITYRNRVGGVSAATNYNYNLLSGAASSATSATTTGATSMALCGDTSGTFYSSLAFDLLGPQLAEPTTFQVVNARASGAYTTPQSLLFNGNHSTATAYDGFELLVAAGTWTGYYTVYGYNE